MREMFIVENIEGVVVYKGNRHSVLRYLIASCKELWCGFSPEYIEGFYETKEGNAVTVVEEEIYEIG